MGETPVPAIAGRLPGTGSVTCGLVPLPGLVPVPAAGLLAELSWTTSVADAANAVAPGADAVAVTRTCSPRVALACTGTVTSSSSASPIGRAPMAQVAAPVAGQTVNFGSPRCGAELTAALTETSAPAAFVLHTQTTKAAACPAVTLAVADNDWTPTQSCAAGGGGDVGETLGVGLGDVLGLVLGLGLGLGELVLADGDALPEALGDPLDGVPLGFGGMLLETDGLTLADARWLRRAVAFASTAVSGNVAQTDLAVGAIATTTAPAEVIAAATGPMPRTITTPSAPTAPGLMISPATACNLALVGDVVRP